MEEVIGVVGAGTMGNGIAQVFARAGYKVVMRDVAADYLARGLSAIDKSLQRDVDKERLSADEKNKVVARIQTATDLNTLSSTSLVVEAITEDLNAKLDVFRSLDQITPP